MKVYAAPEGITLAPDYSNYDRESEAKKEDEYLSRIKNALIKDGYNGPLTGEIARFGVADGYAQYMFADAGRKSCLIHLDIGDAWSLPYIERLTKADIVKNIQQQKAMAKLFGRR